MEETAKKEKKKISIRTDRQKFFRQYVEIINGMSPSFSLMKRELDIFAQLLYYYDKYKHIEDEKVRWKMVFDYDTRVAIINYLKIERASLDNYLSMLRRKEILHDRRINPKFLFTVPDNIDTYSIEFEFIFNNNEQ